MCVHTSHRPYGIHLLCCAHGNERTRTHDAIHDTFAAITWDANFHVGWKQLHAFPSTTFNFSYWQVEIVLTKNDIHTLAKVVIANWMWADLLPWFCATQGFVGFDVVQANERSYHNRHPTNQFLPLAIEVFGCLHKHGNVFLHDCANAIWSLKGRRPSSFYLDQFSSLKSLNQITKDASVFHLKSGGSRRLSYFLTFALSRHTFHHHDWSITSHWFLTYKYSWPSIGGTGHGHGEIFTATLNQLDILSLLLFSLFYSFVCFPNLRCVS